MEKRPRAAPVSQERGKGRKIAPNAGVKRKKGSERGVTENGLRSLGRRKKGEKVGGRPAPFSSRGPSIAAAR